MVGGGALVAGSTAISSASVPARVLLIGLAGTGLLLVTAVLLVLASGASEKRLLPLDIVLVRALSCWHFRLACPIGRIIGGADEDLRSAFLALQNRLVLSWRGRRKVSRLLVLLPQCLEAGVRARIESLLECYECSWDVVKGGSEALAVVKGTLPDGLLAVACERDLLHGLMTVGGSVPWVVVLPNIQGERPCRSTGVDLDRLVQTMDRLAEPKAPGQGAGRGNRLRWNDTCEHAAQGDARVSRPAGAVTEGRAERGDRTRSADEGPRPGEVPGSDAA
jgi:hypothetical protein